MDQFTKELYECEKYLKDINTGIPFYILKEAHLEQLIFQRNKLKKSLKRV